MFDFIRENLGTIVVGAGVFSVLALIAINQIKNRLTGKSSCSCGCENCTGCPSKKQIH